MKRVAFFTTSRAEFGLLTPIIKEADKRDEIDVMLFAGGAHFLKSQGNTINFIAENFELTDKFDFANEDSSVSSLNNSLSKESLQLAEIFNKHKFDFVLLLGDRFELLPIVSFAVINKIPIGHIHGGEITEGAIDEQVRHMISKASHLHFVSCEEYKNNLIKMGEDKFRIINSGAPATDNMLKVKKSSKEIIFNDLNMTVDEPTIILTYHPVTLENEIGIEEQIMNVFSALKHFNFQVIITAPNIDEGKNKIVEIISEIVEKYDNYFYIESLGMKRYLSLLPHCEFMLGNSSSGLIEAPFYKIPTVNIGDRQKGRIRHESVIDTGYSVQDIIRGINQACSPVFRKKLSLMEYKFGYGNASEIIVNKIIETDFNQEFLRKKLVVK